MPKVLLIKPLPLDQFTQQNKAFNEAHPIGTVFEAVFKDDEIHHVVSNNKDSIIIDSEQECFKCLDTC